MTQSIILLLVSIVAATAYTIYVDPDRKRKKVAREWYGSDSAEAMAEVPNATHDIAWKIFGAVFSVGAVVVSAIVIMNKCFERV